MENESSRGDNVMSTPQVAQDYVIKDPLSISAPMVVGQGEITTMQVNVWFPKSQFNDTLRTVYKMFMHYYIEVATTRGVCVYIHEKYLLKVIEANPTLFRANQ
jgi:hypothetical protein